MIYNNNLGKKIQLEQLVAKDNTMYIQKNWHLKVIALGQ